MSELTCLTFTDLTAEHSLLAEVRASQQRFEALYKGAPVPAYTWQNGARGLVLIDYNDAAAKLSGGKADQASGQLLGSSSAAYYRDDPQLLGGPDARASSGRMSSSGTPSGTPNMTSPSSTCT